MSGNSETIVFLNSNSDAEANLLGVGVHQELVLNPYENNFDQLERFLAENKKWVFGYLGYDLKNDIENLESNNHDGVEFPAMCFFVPKVVYSVLKDAFEVVDCYDEAFLQTIRPEELLRNEEHTAHSQIQFNSRTPKSVYLSKVESLLEHIQRGDIYEANYCVEFFKDEVELAPFATYWAANELTKAPYSVYFQHGEICAISCSPELYLEKYGSRLTSKPIKGTRKRGEDFKEDERLKQELRSDLKERSENVMIVDLVRNDLSRIAKKDSVSVEELCGIYSFDTVHHMISTVTCELQDEMSPVDVLRASFPMGSMTGAPKISAMNLIESHEDSKRGLYSGAIGYFTPEGDFTFNVVIRTLLYNARKKYLSLMAGGAITAKSDPESEYRECLLKAAALKKAIYEFD